LTYALSPTMQKLDGMRIVLNWGASPRDLDGHLVFPGNHVWFRKQQGQDADLDVDHIDGFGPETITISRKHVGERYTYAVQDYSDKADPATTQLSQSDAKVFVYIGQTLIRTYYVPKERIGNVWTVFTVSEAGEFQDINSMSGISVLGADAVTAEAVFGPGFGSADRVASPVLPAPPVDIPASAHKLNVEGEAAYKAGDYLNAIRLFQAAIDEASSYGQAYSNLGLVFQKSGRVAEALWANRKAIALATGPQASTTRASTHFNNGRIYEEAGEFGDALREYLAAQGEKANPTYDNAVTRMRARGVN
jgi:tetratricopeptide (TPR) repeat protein